MSQGSVCVRPNLFWRSSRCGISDRPSSLFPGPELCLLQNINQHWEDVGINYCLLSRIRHDQRQALRQDKMWKNDDSKADYSWSLLVPVLTASLVRMHHLYLCSVSCCDVGDGPACLLPYRFFSTAEEVQQTRQGWAVQYHLEHKHKPISLHLIRQMESITLRLQQMLFTAADHIMTFFFWSDLCLNVIASDNVSHSSQRRRGNLVVSVPVKKRAIYAGCYVFKSTPTSRSERTWAVQQGACRHQSQWRLGSCHWGHRRGKTRPSMRLPAGLGHCWIKVWTALASRATPETHELLKADRRW